MWLSFLNWLSQSASWLLVGVLLVALLGVIGIIIWKLKEKSELAIVLAAGLSILITIPLVSTINFLVEQKARDVAISEKMTELESLKTQVENEFVKKENLEKENEILEQKLKLNSLNDEINLLKASQVSAMQFEKIAELALIKANIEQTKVWHELIGDEVKKGKGIIADFYDDKILVVNTYDIDAKIGIDFKNIKVKKINKNKIQVTGIVPKYVGASKNVKDNIIKEIRRNNYNKDGTLTGTIVENKAESIRNADSYEAKFDKEYQKSLENMENWSFLKDAVVSLGENFVTMIFGGIYKEIEFVDSSDETFLPMETYLLKEIANSTEESNKLTNLLPKIEEAKTAQE